MLMPQPSSHRLAKLAGMIGPVLFVSTFTIEGWFRPGYEARAMFVSELSLGPCGWIQMTNFVVLGILFLIFTRGVAEEFGKGRASKAGFVLLAIIGASFVASGFFNMDPVRGARFAPPPDQLSWHAVLHGFFGNFVFSLAPAACFVFAWRFRDESGLRRLMWWTLAAGVVLLAAVTLMAVGPAHPPAAPNVFNDWLGAIQRTAPVGLLAWVFVFAARLTTPRSTRVWRQRP